MHKQNYSCLWVHLVWSTKKREPLIHADIAYLLYEQLRKIAVEKNYHLNFVNGMPDHIHLLVGYEPKFSISNIVKDLKGSSSRWINEQQIVEAHFDWQDGYYAVSLSPSNLKSVRSYIKNQQKHHLNQSFEDEMTALKDKIAIYR